MTNIIITNLVVVTNTINFPMTNVIDVMKIPTSGWDKASTIGSIIGGILIPILLTLWIIRNEKKRDKELKKEQERKDDREILRAIQQYVISNLSPLSEERFKDKKYVKDMFSALIDHVDHIFSIARGTKLEKIIGDNISKIGETILVYLDILDSIEINESTVKYMLTSWYGVVNQIPHLLHTDNSIRDLYINCIKDGCELMLSKEGIQIEKFIKNRKDSL